MNPCASNRKRIAWFALEILDEKSTRDLREHLRTCAGCRSYLEEISNVTAKLTEAEVNPDILVPESFHQRLTDRLHSEERESSRESFLTLLRAHLSNNWRLALRVLGATTVLIV